MKKLEKTEIMARINIDALGRCISANCVYVEQDIVVEHKFPTEEEALKFYCNIADHVYKDHQLIYDPLVKKSHKKQLTEAELLGQRITELELLLFEGGMKHV